MGNDDIDFVEGCDTITLNGQTVYSVNPEPEYKVSYVAPSVDSGMIASTPIDTSNIIVNTSNVGTHTFVDNYTIDSTYEPPIEFEDEMPNIIVVHEMCAEYPTLKTAYEKFKTVYKMVEQDYKGKIANE
ncbi:MAG: hypothetical protein CMO59_14630 [Verrucomicrobiales bacterium]|nr:hypothetical protein [Verrucomicrobiales bacterium]|tara:strand:- start:185 stop:571 length:387 start_codon:yes stop_codon:yes gene_type:complete